MLCREIITVGSDIHKRRIIQFFLSERNIFYCFLFILQFVLREAHSHNFSQSKFSTECDLVLPLGSCDRAS